MIRITDQDLQKAAAAREIIISTLQARGIPPKFETAWPITRFSGFTILFGVLDIASIEKLEHYTSGDLVHHLSTVLRNKRIASAVFVSNSSGLRYGIIISEIPKIPSIVNFPEQLAPGRVLLGDGIRGTVFSKWNDLGHVLVGGMTRSGKSTFIRALVYQAQQDGIKLLVCDPWSVTFAAIENDPALLMPVQRIDGVLNLLSYVRDEISRRERMYKSISGYPETLDEYNALANEKMPRILVVLEELNATINQLGGPTGEVGSLLSSLMWTSLKFGIHIVLASQDFSAKFLGTVRDQIGTTICFRLKNSRVAKNMGVVDASKIPASRQGLAVSDRFGVFQAYYLSKSRFATFAPQDTTLGGVLTDSDIAIMRLAISEGKLSIPLLKEKMEMTERQARGLLNDWEQIGWVQKDPSKDNARVLTDYAIKLLSEHEGSEIDSLDTDLEA